MEIRGRLVTLRDEMHKSDYEDLFRRRNLEE
jgi:hypothetical protein